MSDEIFNSVFGLRPYVFQKDQECEVVYLTPNGTVGIRAVFLYYHQRHPVVRYLEGPNEGQMHVLHEGIKIRPVSE